MTGAEVSQGNSVEESVSSATCLANFRRGWSIVRMTAASHSHSSTHFQHYGRSELLAELGGGMLQLRVLLAALRDYLIIPHLLTSSLHPTPLNYFVTAFCPHPLSPVTG
jgi:hypothetical protein